MQVQIKDKDKDRKNEGKIARAHWLVEVKMASL